MLFLIQLSIGLPIIKRVSNGEFETLFIIGGNYWVRIKPIDSILNESSFFETLYLYLIEEPDKASYQSLK
jgi:hypothetical protein